MSAVKKYAGLPDLDSGAEIYETAVPELTETSTLPTDADSLSDDGNHNPNLIRQGLDPDAARQKFEPYNVDASNVNFSDTIGGGRRDYQIRSRRRRRRAALAREQQDEYTSDESEEETVQGRLIRLKKEVAALQAEIEKADKRRDGQDDSDYEDTVDRQAHETQGLMREADELRGTLDSVSTLHRKQKGSTLEEEFMRKLQAEDISAKPNEPARQTENLPQSSLSAIAAFSDRLTLLETALGVSPLAPTQAIPTPVFPALKTLSNQIETLHSVLAPVPDGYIDGVHESIPQTSTVHLDPIAEKIRLLISESKRLEDSRKTATRSFEELLETRDRHAHLFHSQSAIHSTTEQRLSRQIANGEQDSKERPGGQPRSSTINAQFTPLFLDSQASKISALYNVLPAIQSLQPLLPVVLERLRALSVIHAGAADVKSDMDDFENRLSSQEEDIKTWQEALENVEKAMQENKEIMKDNVGIVGGQVRNLEERVRRLGSKR